MVGITAAVVLAVMLPEHMGWVYSERGPFEAISPWAWIGLAVAIPIIFREVTLEVVAGMIVCGAAAAREWDWHVRFTEYSVLKPPFYYREGLLHERLIAGAAVALALASLFVLARWQVSLRPWSRPVKSWVWITVLAISLMLASKFVDRLPGILSEDFGLPLGTVAHGVSAALEESVEMMVPFFFAMACVSLAIWLERNDGARSEPGIRS